MKQKTIDIILLTCNRCNLSKQTIDGIFNRIKIPFGLIVIDNASKDDTPKMLMSEAYRRKFKKLILLNENEKVNIAGAYNIGLKYVETEYFLTMQDDIIIPDLEPCVSIQLMDLMDKYPEQGGIGCRIQRIPNIKWLEEDLTPARKSLSAYCRIQRKSDIDKLEDGFGHRDWDDLAFFSQMNKLNKACSWASDLWCDHIGGRCENRGYEDGYKRDWGWNNRKLDIKHKPYPKIDLKTNIPLKGEKIYK